MKVICFKGKSNKGKSTIIKKILNDFFRINLIPDRKDFCLSFVYEGKKIGICSYGDDPYVLDKLRTLKNLRCNLIICASRTKGELFEGIKKMFNKKNIEYIICDGNKKDNEKISKFKRSFNKYC